MNVNIPGAPAVQDFLVRHLAEVFATMLSLPAVPLAASQCIAAAERVSGSVAFVGEAVTGAVYLHLPATLAATVTRAMLGLPGEKTPAVADVNDVVGEVTNMLAGGLKSWFCDAGAVCALTTPAIIRGSSFQVLPCEGVTRIQFGFESGGSPGEVEVHLKITHSPISP
jgi:chemotaxis protein CheX